ncbi:16S rRNA (cytidine(1402)-2'-O)-methyltransferase [Mycoplasmopsis lipophila]|uniref:16S rRNA (cytidine(1402)-2'-O)-methyltransferase n=1 Tax=Mycoplasmopsis lipophila TaxID=2117 RepID=UPI003872E6CE
MSKLFIVGTPIGNLKDITLRALETLELVDFIACEDTRVTSKLLQHYNIKKSLLIYNKFNEKESTKGIINLLDQNKNIALVSDAGMPLLSDPGFILLKEVKLTDHEIIIIPGVNAAITAFALANFSNTFTFNGFPKETSVQRQKELQKLNDEYAHIFYVAPHKLINFLNDIHLIFQDKADIFLVKELTKIYEMSFIGTPLEILKQLNENNLKGEFTLVLKIKKEEHKKINKYAKFSKID